MKKSCISIVAATMLLCGCRGGDTFTVEGVVADFQGTHAVLSWVGEDGDYIGLDTCEVTGGRISLAGRADGPRLGVVYDNGLSEVATFIIEPGRKHRLSGRFDGTGYRAGVQAGRENKLYTQYRNRINELLGIYDNGELSLEERIEALARANRTPELFVEQYGDRPAAVCELYRKTLVENVSDPEQIRASLGRLSARMRDSYYGRLLEKRAAMFERTMSGAMFTDAELTDRQGAVRRLSEAVGTGVPAVLLFWTSEAESISLDMVTVNQAFEQYGDRVRFVAVSLDSDPEKWAGGIERYDIAYLNLRSAEGWDGPVAELYNVKRVPVCYVFNPDGTIAQRTRAARIVEELAKMPSLAAE